MVIGVFLNTFANRNLNFYIYFKRYPSFLERYRLRNKIKIPENIKVRQNWRDAT